MNKNIKTMEYAVRGPLLVRAIELEKQLEAGEKKPFKKVIKANLGDAHAMGQKPLTFYRQVLALVSYPELLKDSSFPSDTICRAEELLSACKGGSVGSYSESFGIEIIRKHVAEFICNRDGFESDWKNILLSAGASDSIKNVLKLLNQPIDNKPPGVMIPIPQYPLYSASLAEFGMTLIGYYLQESNNWGLDMNELSRSLCEAQKHCHPRAIVVINPGNPTGQVLTRCNIEDIIKFAYENKLVLLADEVYQSNVYAENSEFHSMKKIINEMGKPYSEMELASFMSCSKGYMGECGLRGAYCELLNFDPDVMANFSKCISSMLCPTVLGQCLLDCVVKPPVEGEPSYDLYSKEKNEILEVLKIKSKMIYEFFNGIKGFSCNEVQGAMYAFPKIDMPEKALQEAKSKNMPADTFYAFQLLESTGICVIPGTGFKQMPDTYHLRTTILPSTAFYQYGLRNCPNYDKKQKSNDNYLKTCKYCNLILN
ncbi:Alanine aminotransferase, putative [Pediculus humanus corporis]|uniref:alanine transaminase n=1 Tax=Pediculus humanus subsp. corporis TaxID=121224 RepID=E0VVS1_PEDHC|nr:Alanine aminotransferase, putative [Pediculus humanus corporis]EEB17477.1 Alanine aminotransferase, putative [Pediculus humanus corporis]